MRRAYVLFFLLPLLLIIPAAHATRVALTSEAAPNSSTGTCPNGICEPDESVATCPADCPSSGNCDGDGYCEVGETCSGPGTDCIAASCGNGICDYGEGGGAPDFGTSWCKKDCMKAPYFECGNLVCQPGKGENPTNCPADCPCDDDGICEPLQGEDNANCSYDCPIVPVCGDTFCNGDESANPASPTYCPADCNAANGTCDPGETIDTNPVECFCGNATCDEGESAATCAADCVCNNNYVCDAGENANGCPVDCRTGQCGDKACQPQYDEDFNNCSKDCTFNEHYMAVGGLGGASQVGPSNWTAFATILVNNPWGSPIPSATVKGTWKVGSYYYSASCITGADGMCFVRRGRIGLSRMSVKFTVKNLVAPLGFALPYNVAANEATYVIVNKGEYAYPQVMMHVGSLTTLAKKTSTGWKATATVLVVAANDQPLPGVTVKATWQRAGSLSVIAVVCKTAANGKCSLSLNSGNGIPSVTFSITNLVLVTATDTYHYDSTANEVLTTVDIDKPQP